MEESALIVEGSANHVDPAAELKVDKAAASSPRHRTTSPWQLCSYVNLVLACRAEYVSAAME